MASTSLAQQLRKLATPQTRLLVPTKKRVSFLFDPHEAASIDRASYYDVGLNGLDELKEINGAFEEFRNSLFDESSMNLERVVETGEVNDKLNAIIKKFLHLLSPYLLLKPAHKALEWLIVRFHINEFNVDELICSALPYHGTRLFARLIQIFDLRYFNPKWQWLLPLQKKGLPLSKTALFNHSASDVTFLKMICEFTIDSEKILGRESFKLTTLFGFYSTTVVGTIQNITELSELHLSSMLPSIFHGLSSSCVDYTAAAFIIIGSMLTKLSFQERLLAKLAEKIAKVKHIALQTSVVTLLNILYQNEDFDKIELPVKAIKCLIKNEMWVLPVLGNFVSTRIQSNVFYLLLIRDTLRLLHENEDDNLILPFLQNALHTCRVDDKSAEKLIRIIIDESKKHCKEWCCELVQNLEYQYPIAWDHIVSELFQKPSDSLSQVLGFTSVTVQVQIFEKLNNPNAVVRVEAIKYIANNVNTFKVKYIENSLRTRWDDEDPNVVEAMFLLPEEFRFSSLEVFEKLLLKCWLSFGNKWNSLLLKVIQSLSANPDVNANPMKFNFLLLPFLISSSKNVQKLIMELDLPFIKIVKREFKSSMNMAVVEALKNPKFSWNVEEIIAVYRELPKADVHIFILLLLLSNAYEKATCKTKSRIISFFFEDLYSSALKKVKWKRSTMKWSEYKTDEYCRKTAYKIPKEVVYKFMDSVIEHSSFSDQSSISDWWDFGSETSELVATFYKYLSQCRGFNIFIPAFIEKHFNNLRDRIQFLCNMCFVHQNESSIQLETFHLMNLLLKNSTESYSWMLNLESQNITIPCLLACLYSLNSDLRTMVMETAEILSTSLGVAISDNLTYLELVKYILQYRDEIILDREQVLSCIYTFLSQDDDVQSLLSASVRCFTGSFLETLLECIISESTPLPMAASLIPVIDYLKDETVITKLIHLADRILRSSNYPNWYSSLIVRSVIDKFNVNTKHVFKNETVFSFIDFCMTNCTQIKLRKENGIDCIGTILLNKLSVDIYDALESNVQKYLLNATLKLCIRCDIVDLVAAANSFMKKIKLDCALIVPYLENMKNSASVISRKSLTMDETADGSEKADWFVGIALLEVLQNKKKVYNSRIIVPYLFEVLQKCCEVDDYVPVEYAKQLCLSSISNCAQKLADNDAKNLEKLFNVELIVNCIRMSPNSQTHHHALMLLAHCATFAANQVLHNIMAIFTFMGSSVLRQDDAFSFQIISNILETIVPLLVLKDGNEFTFSSICAMLKVFAASIPDIPEHRRVPLLVKLMKILRNGEFLHVLLILAMEHLSKSTAANNKTMAATYMEVLQEVHSQLSVPVTLSSFCQILSFINDLPHNIDEKKNSIAVSIELFNLQKHTNKELCHFKYLLVNFIATVLSGTKFIQQVSELDLEELKSLEVHFKGIIEQALLYVKSVMDYSPSSKTASAKYWKVMVSQTLEILNKTNALLTCDTFLTVVKDLLSHECLLIQRKSMELLNWRLQQSNDSILKNEFSIKDLLSLMPQLMGIVNTIKDDKENESFDLKLNQQVALISIKLLAKHCIHTPKYFDKFKKILSKLSTLLHDKNKMNEHVLACMILCITELASVLKVQAIESLPKFFPVILSLFKRFYKKDISQNDIILVSIIIALQKIVETVPNFLSPYLESILFEISRIMALVQKDPGIESNNEDLKPSSIVYKLKLIRQKIASEIPTRVLLPSISSAFAALCETRNFNAIRPLLIIVVNCFPKNSNFSHEFTSLFLTILDFRCTADSVSYEEILLVEEHVIEILCDIMLKCSETTFRPFYQKLYDWGLIMSKKESKKDRILTYFRLLHSLSERLKSIFVLFAANFIRNAVDLLNDYSQKLYCEDPNKTVLLVDSILKTLHNVFKYDTVKFLTKERFDLLLEPLVNQIENTIGDYKTRSTGIIIPCLARFAAATPDDSLWKQFNYLILLKTKHHSPEIRLTALEIICTFATYLGDNFLPFLPETVPFLAELLEDEVELVEKQTHKAVQRLEQILEEPIQKYF